MLLKLKNYIEDQWIEGNNDGQILMDSVKGEPIAIASSSGIDFEKMLQYGRKVGGTNLRKLTFHERGRMLKALALFLTERKSLYYPISYMTGATKADSWVDIDGGIGTLFAYASLRKKFPNQPFYVDGDPSSLSKSK